MTLAVAVGVNLVVFTVVNALWLRPGPIPDGERVVTFANAPWIGLVGLEGSFLKPFEDVAGQVMTDDESQQSTLQPQVEFDGVERADVWIPSNLVPRTAPAAVASGQDSFLLMAFARLHSGQTPADAVHQIRGIADDRLQKMLRGLAVVPVNDVFGSPDSRTFVINEGNALGVVGGLAVLVLVGGCATLMALVLVHYERRRRELAVRIALGVSRRRLIAELSRELAVVAAAGTAGAILVATWGLLAIPSLSLPGEARQREFGVRVALGATPRDLVWCGLSAALAPVAIGVTAGLLAAAVVARVFTSLLAGLSAPDPLTYAAVAVTMLGSAVLAGLGTAWRLRRMTPTDALRAN